MAINFLNTVNLNQNQLVSASIENLPNDPTTNGVLGQLIFNTGSNTLKVCTTAYVQGPPVVNSVYTEVGGGVESIVLNDGTYINVNSTGTATDPIFAPDLSAVDGTSDTTTKFLSKDNTWDVPSYTTNINTTYDLNKAAGDATLILSADSVTQDSIEFSGTANEISLDVATEDSYIIGLPDDVIITTSLQVNNGAAATRSSFGYQVTIPVTPLVSTDAASKGYVDGLVSGGLTFKGTFNAATGEIVSGDNNGSYLYQLVTAGTDFDPSKARVAISIGDYYVVATAGIFYGTGGTGSCDKTTNLDIGDSIIAVADAVADASICANWSVVQSDEGVTDFTNTNGGTYVAYETTHNLQAGSIDIGDVDLTAANGTTVTTSTRFLSKLNEWAVPQYTTNTDETYDLNATQDGDNVDLNLTSTSGTDDSVVQLTAGSNITLTRDSATEITIASTDTGALGKNILLNTSDAWVSSSAAGGITTFAVDVSNANVFNGTVGAVNVKCEVIDARTTPAGVAGQTVYADITRGVNAGGATFGLQSLNISFTGTPASSAYRVLLTYIG